MSLKTSVRLMVILSVVALLASCTKNADSTASNATSSGKPKLLFFLNPYGSPCQMQDSILKEIASQIESKVTLVKIGTDDPQNRPYFYQYGIRGLPQLILVDSAENVVNRFSPGIHNKETILESIKQL